MKLVVALTLLIVGAFVFALVNDNREPAPTTAAEGTPLPASAEAKPIIVELFTSEGCSSCPPADEVLARLEQSPPVPGVEVIALSQHVDYWNRLGWTDPFSSTQFSVRQSEYARAFGKDGVYTPQMIVDGQTEFVGSNMGRARDAIAQALKSPKATVRLERKSNQDAAAADTAQLSVHIENLPAMSAGDTAEVLLAVTETDLQTNVSRGENSGRRLRHIAVVRQFNVIGNVNMSEGKAFTAAPVVAISDGWKRENLRAVVFVQERASRQILGAATIRLASK